MNHVERFRAVMNFQPVDRLPRWGWAMWWDRTIARWHGERSPRQAAKPPFSRSRFHVEAPNGFGYGALRTRSRG